MVRTVTTAAVQMAVEPAPKAERLARAEALIRRAAGEGAQLVLLPEVFNTGYAYSDRNFHLAEPLSGPTVAWMKRLASEEQIYLGGTLLLRDEEDVYNALLLVASDGQVWRYDKQHPWVWERTYFREGKDITVAETPWGRFGLLVCWDQAHPRLWERYAGRVDALLVCSAPPAAHDMTFVFPDGTRLPAAEAGPLPRQMKRTSCDAFGGCFRRQGAALGVPVVNTAATGTFRSPIPLPRLSTLLFALTRVDLWPKILGARSMEVEMPFYHETWVTDRTGQVLARAEPGQEGYALATVTLPDERPRPQGEQPPFGISPFAYAFDEIGNLLLAPVYRQKVRRALGRRMAPVRQSTRRWTLALVVVALLAFLLGRLGGRDRRS